MKCALAPLALAILVMSGACSHKNEKVTVTRVDVPTPLVASPHAQAPAPVDPNAPKATLPKLVVKNSQTGKWRGITISVQHLNPRKLNFFMVPPNRDIPLPGTALSMKVKTILSDFTMEGGVVKPGSDELRNPAAQVEISEGGKVVFKGWLFSAIPDDHMFQKNQLVLRLCRIEPAK